MSFARSLRIVADHEDHAILVAPGASSREPNAPEDPDSLRTYATLAELTANAVEAMLAIRGSHGAPQVHAGLLLPPGASLPQPRTACSPQLSTPAVSTSRSTSPLTCALGRARRPPAPGKTARSRPRSSWARCWSTGSGTRCESTACSTRTGPSTWAMGFSKARARVPRRRNTSRAPRAAALSSISRRRPPRSRARPSTSRVSRLGSWAVS